MNLTKMVICKSGLFILGHIPLAVNNFIGLYGNRSTKFYTYFNLFSNTLLYASYAFDILIYYSYNKRFRETFRKFFKLNSLS